MPKPRWLVLNKKIFLAGGGGVLVVMLLLFIWQEMGQLKVSPNQVDAAQVINNAINHTMTAKSYRFSSESKLITDKDYYSKVTGERIVPDKVHIKGNILKTPVEFIQIKDQTYFKDQFSNKWLTLSGNQMAQAELFFTEFNPLAHFNFKDIPEVKYSGTEKVKGKNLQIFELRPNVENFLLESQFNDFKYKVWVDPQEHLIRQAVIQAQKIGNNKNGLQVTINLWDYNQEFSINPPK